MALIDRMMAGAVEKMSEKVDFASIGAQFHDFLAGMQKAAVDIGTELRAIKDQMEITSERLSMMETRLAVLPQEVADCILASQDDMAPAAAINPDLPILAALPAMSEFDDRTIHNRYIRTHGLVAVDSTKSRDP